MRGFCDTPERVVSVRSLRASYFTNLEISEEVIHQKIQDDERCEDSIKDAHKDKPVLQSEARQ